MVDKESGNGNATGNADTGRAPTPGAPGGLPADSGGGAPADSGGGPAADSRGGPTTDKSGGSPVDSGGDTPAGVPAPTPTAEIKAEPSVTLAAKAAEMKLAQSKGGKPVPALPVADEKSGGKPDTGTGEEG